ncbi:hypothetical protein SAMN05421504_11228 [Amycolatopsis xylanica]|uniref:Glycerophosphoryl diester phosphodiesterase membrane domain-containing protein n=1 Tax=Amycolatopsis xylanica TaxID=589385 RepID=A0A1H3RV19_9PSEU|nr:DUF6159 family protein [Amycolatopsis xylanica]SDZ29517.1 hypothetical protein SAMN05421504_11228 [Amycolatopsis xylanica]
MGRLARSFALFKASLRVLRSRKELATFPVLAGVSGLLVALVFLVPAFFVSRNGLMNEVKVAPGSWGLLALFYVAAAFVTVFFNAALISQADVALRGGDPSVGAGLRAAGRNWLRLLGWAIITATVTMILRVIEERLGFLGTLIARGVDVAWSLVTYLVLPVLMLENRTVRESAKRSGEMFKRTWGENLAGQGGIGLAGFLVSLAGVIVLLLPGTLLGGAITWFVCLGLAFCWLLVVSILTSTLSGIYQTALYRYAAEGTVAGEFADVDLQDAFVTR